MPVSKLHIADTRMLELMRLLKTSGKIQYYQEFFDATEFSKENISNVRRGHQSFTVDHIRNACKKYKVNANWIIGVEAKIFR